MPSFLQSRLNGSVPLETVFWRDMLLVGTGINLAATGAALGFLAAGFPPWLGLTVNFLPIPWNLFLLLALWRSAEREGGPPAVTAKVIGLIWLAVTLVL